MPKLGGNEVCWASSFFVFSRLLIRFDQPGKSFFIFVGRIEFQREPHFFDFIDNFSPDEQRFIDFYTDQFAPFDLMRT